MNRYPPQVRKMVRLLGEEDAYSLLAAAGGRKVYIPKSPPIKSLAAVLATAEQQRLCDALGGGVLNLPKTQALDIEMRNALIRSEKGVSIRNLSKKYKLSRRHIILILKANGLRIR